MTTMMFVIMFGLYITFWVVAFAVVRLYVKNLIESVRKEVFDLALLAKDYLKR